MVSVREAWNKVKEAFTGGKPTGDGLECVHLYASVGTTVGIDGFSIPNVAKAGAINVQRVLDAGLTRN
jgi:hypothetical protein